MGWEDKPERNKSNPWGKPPGGSGPQGGGGNRGGGSQEPPDLDEMLRRAQENFRNVMPGGGMGGLRIAGLAAVGVIGLWLASGLYIVTLGEHAVIQRFGAWNRTQTEEGLGYHLPAPIEQVTKVNVSEIRRLNIGFTDYAAMGGNSKQDVPEESLMLTVDRNIVDLDLVIQWNIKSAEDFLFNIQDQENTIKKVAESAIREVVGQTGIFPIITSERTAVADRAQAIIQKNLDEYDSGVNITEVLIDRAEVHPDVQSAFQDVQSAKQDAEDVQNRAEAYREDIMPKARGEAIKLIQESEAYKQSKVAKAKGDADRFESVYAAYLQGKDITKERMYIETMEEVLKSAHKIILDSKAGSQGVVPYLPLNELKKGQ